jgi:hypothetical protein
MYKQLKSVLKKIPVINEIGRAYSSDRWARRLRKMTPDEVFSQVYEENGWGNGESRSGDGSTAEQTRLIRTALPTLLSSRSIATMLDVPCGDFNWMRLVDLSGVNYLGGDIVQALVDQDNQNYGRPGREFKRLDLLTERPPQVDLILCRDCLVHFSYEHIHTALENICASQSTYLLTTTYPEHPVNKDIPTGWWRTLDLTAAPFHFPPPELAIAEGCTEADGTLGDKTLALWRIADLAPIVRKLAQ